MERVNKIAVVVVLVFTLILGFWMLHTNKQRMEECIREQQRTSIQVDTLNLTDTVSCYDRTFTFDTLGYFVRVNITYRKDFADVTCQHTKEYNDVFKLRVSGLMHAFDSCYAEVITPDIKKHQSGRLPVEEKYYTRLVYSITPQGRTTPKLMIVNPKH